MKNLKTILLIACIFISTALSAQTEAYRLVMKKGIDILSSARTSENFIAAANHFERIAIAEPGEWLPIYYSAYSNLTAGLISGEVSLKDQYFDKAMIQVEKAEVISPNNSEIYTLKGYVQFMKMSVDPQIRFTLIGESNASLGKAKQLDPENPRPHFVHGQNTFYTPEAFGGGKIKARPILEEAVKKYEEFKSAGELTPVWGAQRAKMLLAECQKVEQP